MQKKVAENNAKNLASTGFSQLVKIALQMLTGAIVARILTPDDFGVVALTVVLTGLLNRFKDGGISVVSVKIRHMSPGLYSDLFWVNVVLGVLVGGVCILSGYLISILYNDERIFSICLVSSLSYVASGFVVQPDAQLRRDMNFEYIARFDILAAVVSAIVTVAVAYIGYGYWALVIGPLSSMVAHSFLINIIIKGKPKLTWEGNEVWSVVRSAFHVLNANILNHLSQGSAPTIIGYFSGTTILGVFNRINSIASIPTVQIQAPILNVLYASLVSKGNVNELYVDMIHWVNRMLYLSLLISFGATLFAFEIVFVLLGSNWTQYSDLLALASLIILPEAMIATFSTVALALGRYKYITIVRLVELLVLVFLLLLFANKSLSFQFLVILFVAIFVRAPIWTLMVFKESGARSAIKQNGFCSAVSVLMLYVLLIISGYLIFAGWMSYGLTVRGVAFLILVFVVYLVNPVFRHDSHLLMGILKRKMANER